MSTSNTTIVSLAASIVRAETAEASRTDEHDRGALEVATSLLGICNDECWDGFAITVYRLRDLTRTGAFPLEAPTPLAGLTPRLLEIAEDIDVSTVATTNPEYTKGAVAFISAYTGIEDREFLETTLGLYADLARARRRAEQYAAQLAAPAA